MHKSKLTISKMGYILRNKYPAAARYNKSGGGNPPNLRLTY
jgi:hypothetical protein